jgi:hypothetical protein
MNNHNADSAPAPNSSGTPADEPQSSASANLGEAEAQRFEQQVDALLSAIEAFEHGVDDAVKQNLHARANGNWREADDNIFAPFTWYTDFCWKRLVPERAIALWVTSLAEATAAAEAQLRGRNDPNPRIHKGAPLYNVGLNMFMSGALDRALVFLGEAGAEDERSGRGPAGQILVGNNALSEQLLVNTVFAWISPPNVWGTDYQNSTGQVLVKQQFKDVVTWTATRLNDGIQLMLALHRLAGSQVIPDNAASRHLRVQAVADLVLVVESTLRRWQAPGIGQLHPRMTALLPAGSGARLSFDTLHNDFNNRYAGHDRETIPALNWAIDESLARFDRAATVSERAGIACYLTYKLRNNLMHVIDDSVNLYADRPKLVRAAGLVFCAIRISMHGEQGTLGAI